MTNGANSSTAQSSASIPEQAKPGPQHRRLDLFAGKWNMEGQQYESSFGPPAKLTAVETFEW